ncbi:MAG: cyclic nucleotide-binding domain-containing protein [Gammaproteobacteria bacterium]|nr:cyclic nucleotide-binding domain-containing protein [Gammaproteobacteria bacterium]
MLDSSIQASDSGAKPVEMLTQEPHELLARLPNLSERVVAALCEVVCIEEYADGALIMAEGERSDHLFVIAAGRVEVYRTARMQRAEQRIVILGPGELLGELALIDGAPRSLSARAHGNCCLLRVCPDHLARLPSGEHLLIELKMGLGAAVVKRMRERTDNYVEVLERELDATREQQRFGQFFLYTMTLMAIGMVVNDVITRHLTDVNIYSLEFVWLYTLLLLVPSIVIVQKMGLPLRQLGVTQDGLRVSLIEGGVISFAIILLTAILTLFNILPGRPIAIDPLTTITYFLHSFLQELFGRGFLLSSFQRFLNDERGIKSVVVTSILFGIFHIHFGLIAVALTAVSGIFFGTFYLRHKNLAGVTLVHFFSGVCAFSSGLL